MYNRAKLLRSFQLHCAAPLTNLADENRALALVGLIAFRLSKLLLWINNSCLPGVTSISRRGTALGVRGTEWRWGKHWLVC